MQRKSEPRSPSVAVKAMVRGMMTLQVSRSVAARARMKMVDVTWWWIHTGQQHTDSDIEVSNILTVT